MGPKPNADQDHVKFCTILLNMVHYQLQFTYSISLNYMVSTNGKKLVDRQEQIMAEEAIAKE